MRTLILAEHDNARLHSATRNAVTAATRIGGDVDVLVVGYDARPVAAAAARIPGVARVLHAEAEHFATPTAENVAATLAVVLRSGSYSHLLAAATTCAKGALPRVAALVDLAPLYDKNGVISTHKSVRPN